MTLAAVSEVVKKVCATRKRVSKAHRNAEEPVGLLLQSTFIKHGAPMRLPTPTHFPVDSATPLVVDAIATSLLSERDSVCDTRKIVPGWNWSCHASILAVSKPIPGASFQALLEITGDTAL